jgi:DNA-binding transcriptional LysR family regulator
MELRQLEIFRILAHELNFTRTARQAHCVQSNVSVQVRALEQELGVQLFERLGQQVRLTPHGARLLSYAERILRLVEEAHATTRHGGSPAGALTIGSPESVLTYRLPPAIRDFRAKYPKVELVFRSVSSSELMPRLERGELDLALFIDDTWKSPKLMVEALCAEPVALVIQPKHALLRRAGVCARDLSAETFLLTDSGCAYRSKLERVLARTNVRPKAIMEFSSVETIKQCAALGMGVACLPEIVVNGELASGALARLSWTGLDLTMKSLVAWHQDKWLSPAMQAFLSTLRARLCAPERPATAGIHRLGTARNH